MPQPPTQERSTSPTDLSSRAYWNGTIKMSLSKFFILRVLYDRPMHGYEIARTVEAMTNGCCSPSEGTIYPVLREFEAGGYVTVEPTIVAGRRRKVYALTDDGHQALRVAIDAWMEVTEALVAADRIVDRPDAPPRGVCS